MQEAAKQGLAKLKKYSTPAKLHHSYILGTSKFSSRPIRIIQTFYFVVLHPCLRSHWFSTTVNPVDAAAQEEAIGTVEDIFKYVAETYLEAQTSPIPLAVPKPDANPVMKTHSFLASACSFQRPIATAARMPVSKRTPHEFYELTRYFNFEAAPIEPEEGIDKDDNEPSAQDILLNPLLWWKVSIY